MNLSFKQNGKSRLHELIFNKQVLLILIFSLFTIENIYAGGDEAIAQQGLLYRGGIIVIALIIAWISRGFLLRKMNSLMMAKSKQANADLPGEDNGNEVAANTDLVITEMDAGTEINNAIAIRETMVLN